MAESTFDPRPFVPPLFTHRFRVVFERVTMDGHGGGGTPQTQPLCEGAFAEVSGLEASLEPKAIKEGGVNYGAHQRAGSVSFGTVVLKRGITRNRDLWAWWALVAGAADDQVDQPAGNGAWAQRLQVTITLLDNEGTGSGARLMPALGWRLERAMPVKFKAADFNGRASDVGIEELHLVHEGLHATAAAPQGARS